jgi:hypothetical protein
MPLEVQLSHHLSPPPAAVAAEPGPSKSQLKKEIQSLKRKLAAAEEALRAARETTPSGRKRGREEESPAMSSAEKRARAMGMFQLGVIPSPSM